MMQNNYEVTQLRPLNKKKTIVFLDERAAFSLYNGELRKYGIEEQNQMTKEAYEELLENVLFPRAKERALHLVTVSSKTSKEICERLRQGYYPEEICERTIHFLKEYGYVDDFEYARTYTISHLKRKGLRKIKMELGQKGIGEELIRRVLEEVQPDEEGAICRWLEKKAPDFADMDLKRQRRVYSALLYRGYSYDQIQSSINNFAHNV